MRVLYYWVSCCHCKYRKALEERCRGHGTGPLTPPSHRLVCMQTISGCILIRWGNTCTKLPCCRFAFHIRCPGTAGDLAGSVSTVTTPLVQNKHVLPSNLIIWAFSIIIMRVVALLSGGDLGHASFTKADWAQVSPVPFSCHCHGACARRFRKPQEAQCLPQINPPKCGASLLVT